MKGSVLACDHAKGTVYLIGDDGNNYTARITDQDGTTQLLAGMQVNFSVSNGEATQVVPAVVSRDASPPTVVTLGVGDIVGGTFSIFFRRFGYIVPLALIPAFAVEVLSYLLVGPEQYVGDDSGLGAAPNPAGTLLAGLIKSVGQTLTTAFVILAAYDAKLGRVGRLGFYFGGAMRSVVPAVVCSIITGLGIFIGMLLLIIPGLYLYGLWCVVIPAIVIEQAGFGSLERSAELTRDYRWPCVGTLVLVSICGGLVFAPAVGAALGFLVALLGASEGIVFLSINAIGSGGAMGFWGVAVALLYARLREIKEGTRVEDIVDVFS